MRRKEERGAKRATRRVAVLVKWERMRGRKGEREWERIRGSKRESKREWERVREKERESRLSSVSCMKAWKISILVYKSKAITIHRKIIIKLKFKHFNNW